VAFPVTGSRRRTLFIAILLSITLITIDTRGNPVIDKIRSIAREAFSPFQGVARAVSRPFEHTWNGIRDYDRLKRDYEAARREADANAAASIEAESRLREYSEFRSEKLLPTCSQINSRLADVIGRPATNYESGLEISLGSNDGLQQGMPVIVSGGLVGRVGKVSKTRSFIKLISESDVNVQVQISATGGLPKDAAAILAEGPAGATATTSTATSTTTPTSTSTPITTTTTLAPLEALPTRPPGVSEGDYKAALDELARAAATTTTTVAPTTTTTILAPVIERGVMRGDGPGEPLPVSFIRADSPVRVGDAVSTVWDRASLFPGCIPIGRVSSVSPRKGTGELDVKVKPRADLERISFVTVLLWAPDPAQGPVAPATPTTVTPTTTSTTTTSTTTTTQPAGAAASG
jgi:cell shape-determining protein MreC